MSVLNIARNLQFDYYQDLISRPQFKWKVQTYPEDECLVITDYPVFQVLGDKPVVIVPLTKHRVLIGGNAKNLNGWQLSIDRMNLVLAAYANRSVFCAEKAVLEVIAHDLRGNNPDLNPAWCGDARLPFCVTVHRPLHSPRLLANCQRSEKSLGGSQPVRFQKAMAELWLDWTSVKIRYTG